MTNLQMTKIHSIHLRKGSYHTIEVCGLNQLIHEKCFFLSGLDGHEAI